MINETVLTDFNAWQKIKDRLEIANEVLDKKLNDTDVIDLVLADYKRDLQLVEACLEADYHSLYRSLRRARTEIWGSTPLHMLKPGDKIPYKVRLSDEIRALTEEICDDMTRGDPDTSWR
jgi:hypothetical protein